MIKCNICLRKFNSDHPKVEPFLCRLCNSYLTKNKLHASDAGLCGFKHG